ncbi:MAG TPA: hypothetical protein VKP64_04685 [Mycobacteriales bacterium]|nr:hypothetical protein [Mycobacteriales bacterium]
MRDLRVRARLAAVAGSLLLAVLLAAPALAATRDDGEEPGRGLSSGQALLIFIGVPLAVAVLLGLLTYLPSIARGPRYRPERTWTANPVWFGGPDDPEEALRLTSPEEIARTSRGGASAQW